MEAQKNHLSKNPQEGTQENKLKIETWDTIHNLVDLHEILKEVWFVQTSKYEMKSSTQSLKQVKIHFVSKNILIQWINENGDLYECTIKGTRIICEVVYKPVEGRLNWEKVAFWWKIFDKIKY